MNSRNKMLVALSVVLILLVGGGFYVLSNKSSKSDKTSLQDEIKEESYQTLSPDELGLEFMLRSDKKAAKFSIVNAQDIELVEYQISYTKELNGEEIPEALIGEANKKPGEKKISIDYREFGTCSSGVCRYDKVIGKEVKLILKITKTDGSVYQAESLTPY